MAAQEPLILEEELVAEQELELPKVKFSADKLEAVRLFKPNFKTEFPAEKLDSQVFRWYEDPRILEIKYTGSPYLTVKFSHLKGIKTVTFNDIHGIKKCGFNRYQVKRLKNALGKNSRINDWREKYQLIDRRVLKHALKHFGIKPETHFVKKYQNMCNVNDVFAFTKRLEEVGLPEEKAKQIVGNIFTDVIRYVPKEGGPWTIMTSAAKDFYDKLQNRKNVDFHSLEADILAIDHLTKPNQESVYTLIAQKELELKKLKNTYDLADVCTGENAAHDFYKKLKKAKNLTENQIDLLYRLIDWQGLVENEEDEITRIAKSYKNKAKSKSKTKAARAQWKQELKSLENEVWVRTTKDLEELRQLQSKYETDLHELKDLMQKYGDSSLSPEILQSPVMQEFWKAYLSGRGIDVTKSLDAELAAFSNFTQRSQHTEPEILKFKYHGGEIEASKTYDLKKLEELSESDREHFNNIQGLEELPNSLENILQLENEKQKLLGEEALYFASDVTRECDSEKQKCRYYDNGHSRIKAIKKRIHELKETSRNKPKRYQKQIREQIKDAKAEIAIIREDVKPQRKKYASRWVSAEKTYNAECIKEKYAKTKVFRTKVADSLRGLVEKRNSKKVEEDSVTYGTDLLQDVLHFKNNVLIANNINKKDTENFLIVYDILRAQLSGYKTERRYIDLMREVEIAEKANSTNYDQRNLIKARQEFDSFRKSLPHPDLVVLQYTPQIYKKDLLGKEVETRYGTNYRVHLFKDGKKITYAGTEVGEFDSLLYTHAFCERGATDFEAPVKEQQTRKV